MYRPVHGHVYRHDVCIEMCMHMPVQTAMLHLGVSSWHGYAGFVASLAIQPTATVLEVALLGSFFTCISEQADGEHRGPVRI